MKQSGKIYSINISPVKGVSKAPVSQAYIGPLGIEGDGHSGQWHRQASLLSYESIKAFNNQGKGNINARPGDFGENITTTGIDVGSLKIKDIIIISSRKNNPEDNGAMLEVTQIGKECLTPCRIYYEAGFCIMPVEGVFCRVVRPGIVKKGYSLIVRPASPD